MKNIKIYQAIGYILILMLTMTGCELDDNIEGSGLVTTKSHSINEFTDLHIDGVLNVYFKQADNFKVEVRTDDNLHSILHVENIGNTLKIYTDSEDDFEATEMDVFVSAPEVLSFTLDGVTALYVQDRFVQDQILIKKRNTGYMYLNTVTQEFTLISDGVGDVDLFGKTMDATIDNSMIGNISAYEFTTDKMNLSHNGTGTININVLTQLDVNISGVGDVYCKGDPGDISKSGNGIGKLYMVE